MAITVQHGKEEVTTHTDATKWHIDTTEALHIIGPNGNIASYNRGYWANVYQAGPVATKTTAVATLYTKGESNDGQTSLWFNADYADERNKDWAKYTPALGVTMTVTDEVAQQFEQGGRYSITFERAEA